MKHSDRQLNFDKVDPRERGRLLLRWRRAYGWSVAKVAEMLDTSTRTIASIESGAQAMTDAKWDLLVRHLPEALEVQSPRGLVVVLSPEGAPMDVVSADNFESMELEDDAYAGVISSRAVDRITGEPYVHRQRFLLRGNQHVVSAALRWQAAADLRELSTAELAHRWMMRRILDGDLANPVLAPLKQAVAQAREELESLPADAPQEQRNLRIHTLDLAFAALVQEVAKHV